MFLLSHHSPKELHRCYRWGSVYVCARCLGTYSMLIASLAAQLAWRAPLEHPWELFWGIILMLPAAIDWVVGRTLPERFGNGWRTLTGALLGISLGRSLYVHLQRPFPPLLLTQALLTAAALGAAIVIHWRRRR